MKRWKCKAGQWLALFMMCALLLGTTDVSAAVLQGDEKTLFESGVQGVSALVEGTDESLADAELSTESKLIPEAELPTESELTSESALTTYPKFTPELELPTES
ncbi:MAG: hypothetical protein Q4A32_05225 [Lachnospiraceae bacterium]|nr:hypothetical protein [Lachnospiraceae bacterium]